MRQMVWWWAAVLSTAVSPRLVGCSIMVDPTKAAEVTELLRDRISVNFVIEDGRGLSVD